MGTIASLRAFRQPVIRLWRNFSNEVYELRACIETYQLYKSALRSVDRKLTRTERAIEYMFTSPASPQVAPEVHSQGITAATQRQRRGRPAIGRQAYETAMAHTISIVGGRQLEATCALCREPMAPTQALRAFPCLHALHHSCADGLFLHGQESRQWVRCPECRYQLHPDDTGRQMLRQALANSMAAPSPMIQVPALSEGSDVLGVAPAQNGTTRTPEEVEDLAIRAAERVTELKEEAARVFSQLAETADAVAIGRIRARRFLAEFDTTLSRSRGDLGLQLQFSSYSRIGHREMRAIEEVPITVYVD